MKLFHYIVLVVTLALSGCGETSKDTTNESLEIPKIKPGRGASPGGGPVDGQNSSKAKQ